VVATDAGKDRGEGRRWYGQVVEAVAGGALDVVDLVEDGGQLRVGLVRS
jgi:hypothetical protein